MRKFFSAIFLVLITTFAYAQVQVDGYYRSSGTYVQPHHRSSPNDTVTDNYSFKGNVNPYTGETGTNYYRSDSSSPYYGTTSQSYAPQQTSYQSNHGSNDSFGTQSQYGTQSTFGTQSQYGTYSSY